MPTLPVALVNPKDPTVPYDYYVTYENLGLGCLASVLRQEGHEVRIVDAYASKLDTAEAVGRAAALKPRLVGLTGTYQSIPEACAIARELKRLRPAPHICLGGEHAAYSAAAILNGEPAIDSICHGEGEATIVDLARCLHEGGDLARVPGISFRRRGAVVRNDGRPPIKDLDALPLPARDTLEQCSRTGERALIGLLASRGCAYNCHFCNAYDFLRGGMGTPWRRRSPEDIVDELQDIYDRYYFKGMHRLIHFYDANFIYPTTVGRRWVREIAEGILARGMRLSFAVYMRADSLTDGDEELIELLTRAGWSSAFVGLEAGSQDMLDKYNKRTSVEQNHWILNTLHRFGVETTTNGFIMFNPYTTLADARANAGFLLDTDQATFWNLTGRLQLFPGVKLIDIMREDGLLLPDYSHLNVHGYRFADERIALLVDKLSFGDHDVPTRENYLGRYIEVVHFEVGRRLTEMAREGRGLSPEDQHRADRLSAGIVQARQAVQQGNYRFFLRTVESAETGWDEAAFLEMRDAYLSRSSDGLDELRRRFDDYLDYISEAVD